MVTKLSQEANHQDKTGQRWWLESQVQWFCFPLCFVHLDKSRDVIALHIDQPNLITATFEND